MNLCEIWVFCRSGVDYFGRPHIREGGPTWAPDQMTKVPISLQKEAEEEGWDVLHTLKEVSTKGRSEKMRQASL